ncbi:MAG: site-specific DNA-methyltransferase, partial [Candidatus Lokiarchaeota archaeon]|nr:site-specific DNA-methyltransferase [Candidatus Lokiarchaeota archaeon]
MPTLNWIGKEAVEKHHLEIPYRLLEYDDTLSAGDKESGNLLVQGDNLHALKALLPYYGGSVKCIYIDPPYNTGNEKWQYNDNVNAPEIRAWLNKTVGAEGEDLSRHDKWLCMMYPRLQILKKLLHREGAIFISIDDIEQAHLRLLMDEIFGQMNFVCNIIWEKKYTVANDAKYLSDNHDFIICYAKNKSMWRPLRLPRPQKLNKAYKNPDNHPKGPWKATPLHAKSGSIKGENFSYTFKNGVTWSPPKGTFPRFSKDTLKRFDDGNELWFGKDGKSVPSRKTFLSELKNQGVTARTIWNFGEVGHNHEAKDEIKKFDLSIVFDTPKPTKLMKRILNLAADKDDIVMDSFSGSGTVGHAVME